MPSHLDGSIGLCFFNPETDTLEEFSGDAKILLGPFEESVRRFYLVKPSNTIQGKVFSYAKVKVEPSSSAYIVKVRVGDGALSSPEDFKDIVGTECLPFFSNYTNGLIPIDFYTKNVVGVESTHTLDITIEVL